MTELANNLARTSPYTLYQFGILYSIVTQDWVGVYSTAGFILGDLLNGLVLKPLTKAYDPNLNLFKRPNANGLGTGCGIYPTCEKSEKTWGMPSGHSQIVAMFATFWIAYMLAYLPLTTGLYVAIAALVVIALLIMISRIYCKCHNLAQVTVGGLIGVGLGYLLYFIYSLIRD